MTFYHGSPVGGLKELKPFLSEHENQYVYFTQNPVAALLYAVHPVEKPFSWYPYGFDENGTVVYSEYYPNAFSEVYRGKSGFLYECDELACTENPTQINGVYVSRNPVSIDRVTLVPDLYERFMQYKEKNTFIVVPFGEVSGRSVEFVYDDLRQTIKRYRLKQFPGSSMSIFISRHFPDIWNEPE